MFQSIESRLVGELNRYERSVLRHGAVWFFLILLSYYVLRPIREQIGSTYGLKNLSWLFWITFGVMLIAIPLYSVLVGRFHRRTLVPIIYSVFISCLVGFWFAMKGLPAESQIWVARAFFVWISVFGLFVVSFFWSVAGDMLSTEQGRRIFGTIFGCGTLGGLVGSQLAGRLVDSIGVANLLLIPAVLLAVALVVYLSMERSYQRLAPLRNDSTAGKATGGNPFAGFTAVLRSRYLFAIMVFGSLMAVCGTTVYFQQAEIVNKAYADVPFDESQFEDHAELDREQMQKEASKNARTAYFADINFAVSIVTLVFQFVVAGFLMRRIGVGWTLAMLPLLYIAGIVSLALSPTLVVLAVASTLGRAAEYGLCNPAREVLYTAVNREDRYKAKGFIDTVVRRGGDSAAGSIYQGLRETVGLAMTTLSWAVIPFAALWVAVSVFIGQENKRLIANQNSASDIDE